MYLLRQSLCRRLWSCDPGPGIGRSGHILFCPGSTRIYLDWNKRRPNPLWRLQVHYVYPHGRRYHFSFSFPDQLPDGWGRYDIHRNRQRAQPIRYPYRKNPAALQYAKLFRKIYSSRCKQTFMDRYKSRLTEPYWKRHRPLFPARQSSLFPGRIRSLWIPYPWFRLLCRHSQLHLPLPERRKIRSDTPAFFRKIKRQPAAFIDRRQGISGSAVAGYGTRFNPDGYDNGQICLVSTQYTDQIPAIRWKRIALDRDGQRTVY